VVLAGLLGVSVGALVLALPLPLGLQTLGALLFGLAAGLPFAVVFAAAQRLHPEAPGTAVGVVNGVSILLILVATPVAGLAFGLPGDGRLAFAGMAALAGSAVLLLRRAPLERDNPPSERAKERPPWP